MRKKSKFRQYYFLRKLVLLQHSYAFFFSLSFFFFFKLLQLLKFPFSHEDFTTIINETKNYHKLKENVKLMKSQSKDELIKNGTKT